MLSTRLSTYVSVCCAVALRVSSREICVETFSFLVFFTLIRTATTITIVDMMVVARSRDSNISTLMLSTERTS